MVGLGTTDCRWDWRIASVFCVQLFGDCYAWLCRVGSEVVLEKRLWEIKLSTDDDGKGVPRTITSIFQAQACKGIHRLADWTPYLKPIGYVAATGAVQVRWLAVHR